jgi:hypothetical protein
MVEASASDANYLSAVAKSIWLLASKTPKSRRILLFNKQIKMALMFKYMDIVLIQLQACPSLITMMMAINDTQK